MGVQESALPRSYANERCKDRAGHLMDDISEQPEEDFIGTKQAGFHRASARAFLNQPGVGFPSQ